MCSKVKLTGVVSFVLVVLGSVADTTMDIMVFTVLLDVLKKLGFSILAMLVKLMKAAAADPEAWHRNYITIKNNMEEVEHCDSWEIM